MVKLAKKDETTQEIEKHPIENRTTKSERRRKEKKVKKEKHEDFITFSFIVRSILALLIYASVFFSEWALRNVWSPLLQVVYQALNLEDFFWSISNQNDVIHSVYVNMYVENMLYLILFITIVPLFMPEIKDGFRKLKNNKWKLSLIPVIHFCMLTLNIIMNVILSSFVSLPDSSINQDMINRSMDVSVWGNVFPTIIAAPFVEEIIFRVIIGGGIFMLLTTLFNRRHMKGRKILFSIIGLMVSVVLFGFLHVTAGDYLAIFPYLAMGLALGLTYFLSGRNVVMSIALHVYQNLFATIIQLIIR